jgi:protease IV
LKSIKPKTRSVLTLAVAALSVLLAGCGQGAYKITPVPTDRTLEESVVMDEGGLFPPKIALIEVEGLLMDSPRRSLFSEGENPVSFFVEKLDKAAKDKGVKAVILRINSPGGGVTASDLMYSEVLHFKERTQGKRPVVAMMLDVAASGGYYVACSADEIVACPTTITGSIGVIMQMVNFAGTMAKIGVKADAITSGKMKDAGSPLRELKPEEKEIFQTLVNQFFDQFVRVVATGRPGLDEQKVREIADGRVYSGKQALELGLIDRIGTLRETVAEVKKKIGAKKVRVVDYHRPLGWKPNIYAESPATPAQLNLINVTLPEAWPQMEPQFMYLWAPQQP